MWHLYRFLPCELYDGYSTAGDHRTVTGERHRAHLQKSLHLDLCFLLCLHSALSSKRPGHRYHVPAQAGGYGSQTIPQEFSDIHPLQNLHLSRQQIRSQLRAWAYNSLLLKKQPSEIGCDDSTFPAAGTERPGRSIAQAHQVKTGALENFV